MKRLSTPRFPLVLWVFPLAFLIGGVIRWLAYLNLSGAHTHFNYLTPILFMLFVVIPIVDRVIAQSGWDFSRWKRDGVLFLLLFPLWIVLNVLARKEGDLYVPCFEFWNWVGWKIYFFRLVNEGWRILLAGYLAARMPFRIPVSVLALLFGPIAYFSPLFLNGQVIQSLQWWLQSGVIYLAFYWVFSRKNALLALWLLSCRWFFLELP